MSSKTKILTIALVFFTILGVWATTSKADVTGSFNIHISFNPIQCNLLGEFGITGMPDQPCEKTFFKIDFQTGLDINIAISGLVIGLHSHAGVTGFEDIILSFATTLGALEISDLFVFAQPFGVVQVPDGEKIPTCYASNENFNSCLTLFVKKRVEATISLGGVTFSNLGIFEDVNFPDPSAAKPEGGIYTTDDQAFGFGDVLTLEGQTPSGITVTSETGICAEQGTNDIKKHSWDFTVNPNCQPVHVGVSEHAFDAFKVQSGSSSWASAPDGFVIETSTFGQVQYNPGTVSCVPVVGGFDCTATWSFSNIGSNTVVLKVSLKSNLWATQDVDCGGTAEVFVLDPGFFISCTGTITTLTATGSTVSLEIEAEENLPERKPLLFFDFEKLFITGIPLASGLTLDLAIKCIMPGGPTCGFTQTWTITGGPLFSTIIVTTGFQGLPLGATGTSFSDITVKASGGPLSLTMVIDASTFLVKSWTAIASLTINPDTNPASLKLTASGKPGISALAALLTISRSGLTFSSNLKYTASAKKFDFDSLTLTLKATAGIVTFAADVTLDDHGSDPEEAFLLGGNLNFTVNF